MNLKLLKFKLDISHLRFNELYEKFLRRYLYIRNFHLSKRYAIKIMNQNWDYLIVLDACRYDMFKMIVDKNTKFVVSGGSSTQEWLRWNFKKYYNDIVYVAGNPHFSRVTLTKALGKIPFYDVIEVWDFGWDKNIRTVHPKEVTKATINALHKHPNKRMIIHFNQPHYPFIGNEKLLEIGYGLERKNSKFKGRKDRDVWYAAKQKKVSLKEVWIAYLKNLRLAMDEVYKLLPELSGRVIVTSDHGNNAGECLYFGHRSNVRTKALIKVPWYVIKNEKRRYLPESLPEEIEKEEQKSFREINLINKSVKLFLKKDSSKNS
jgi:hypothetical protein